MNAKQTGDDLRKRPGLFAFLLVVQLLMFIGTFKWFIPFCAARDIQGMLLTCMVGLIAVLVSEFAVRRLSDNKSFGLARIFIGFTLLYFVTESVIETILLAAGTSFIFSGARAFIPQFFFIFFHKERTISKNNEDEKDKSQ